MAVRKKTGRPDTQAPEAEKKSSSPKELSLPVSVTGPADIGRLIRELDSLGNDLMEAGLRKEGAKAKAPKTSALMDQTVWVNKLNLLKKEDRTSLQGFLDDVRKKSPVFHISFSADPSPGFLEKLVTWLRREIHPSVLLTIGLQPNIGAGCILRTTNKQFDFSLRQDFLSKRDMLLEQLSKSDKSAAPPAQPEQTAVHVAPGETQ